MSQTLHLYFIYLVHVQLLGFLNVKFVNPSPLYRSVRNSDLPYLPSLDELICVISYYLKKSFGSIYVPVRLNVSDNFHPLLYSII